MVSGQEMSATKTCQQKKSFKKLSYANIERVRVRKREGEREGERERAGKEEEEKGMSRGWSKKRGRKERKSE